MNHIDKQTQYILSDFQCFCIGDWAVPTPDILIKLLYPNVDPNTLILVKSPSLESEEDNRSQSVLREHNNFIVSFLSEDEWLDPDGKTLSIGKDLESICQRAYVNGDIPEDYFSWDTLRYHVANLNYLDYFFLSTVSYNKLTNLSKEATKFYYKWNIQQETESPTLTEYFNDLNEKKDKIRVKFPEYKESEDYWESFIYMAQRYYRDDLMEIEQGKSTAISEIVDITRKNYHQETENRLVKRSKPWQCSYCNKWFERELTGNGKPMIKCKDEACSREWDRVRRRK